MKPTKISEAATLTFITNKIIHWFIKMSCFKIHQIWHIISGIITYLEKQKEKEKEMDVNFIFLLSCLTLA